MDLLKGGRILVQALPRVVDILKRPVCVVFAGDGPDRYTWEMLSRRLSSARPDVTFRFVGWRGGDQCFAALARAAQCRRACDLAKTPDPWIFVLLRCATPGGAVPH